MAKMLLPGDRWMDRQTDRYTDRQTGRQKDRKIQKQKRQKDTRKILERQQKDRKIEMQKERWRDGKKKIERQIYRLEQSRVEQIGLDREIDQVGQMRLYRSARLDR